MTSKARWFAIRACLPALLWALACSPPPTVTPPETGRLSGRVVDGTGAVVAGARVGLLHSNVAVRANVDGAFSFVGLGPGSYGLRVSAGPGGLALSGSKDVTVERAPSGAGLSQDVGDVVVDGTGSFEGRVLRAGAVVTRAVVALEGVTSVPVTDGAFLFATVASGSYVPVVETADGTQRFAAVTIGAGAAVTLDLELDSGSPVSALDLEGEVRTSTGPASGARVRLVPDGGIEAAATDAGGRFVAPRLPPGIYTVVVVRDGLVPLTLEGVVPGMSRPVLILATSAGGCAQGGTGLGANGDDDGDGALEADEPVACRCRPGTLDADADGVCDDADADTDGDGVRSAFDNCPTIDDPDQSDSDGDGVGDRCEDADGDGIFDDLDLCDARAGTDTTDGDGDGLGDTCDLCPADARQSGDADLDGLGDLCDACPSAADDGADTDSDGIPDACDNCLDVANAAQLDGDGDGTGDACEDADDDGLPDDDDLCPAVSSANNADTDRDGVGDPCDACPAIADGQADGDQDGFGDACDTCPGATNTSNSDIDGDGVGDECDNAPNTANATQLDGDGDGVGDAVDTCPTVADATNADGDGDGVGNLCDLCPSVPDADQANADGDARGDACDTCRDLATLTFADGDGDGTGDACEDSDGDGRVDASDNCPAVANAGQGDGDGDGVGDACDNCAFLPNPAQADADDDQVGDGCEVDDDDDGVRDELDNCPTVPNPGQENLSADALGDACDPDDDQDGVPDLADNCPVDDNPGQENLDAALDGQGDACDTDDDGDGVLDNRDNCGVLANPDQADLDDDGDGDACDADVDDDGVDNENDNCRIVWNDGQENADGDPLGDACDPNDDLDTWPDTFDNCAFVDNEDQADLDGDRLGDVCDPDADGDTILPPTDTCPLGVRFSSTPAVDQDRDGCRDSDEDLDDDNDGRPDLADNCPVVANADQADTDTDGYGNACDPCPNDPGLVCTPPTISVITSLPSATGMYDAELGEYVRVTTVVDGFAGAPAFSWRIVSGPRFPLDLPAVGEAAFVPDGIGTVALEVTASQGTRTATGTILVNAIPSRAAAVWIDPGATPGLGCNDANTGATRASPKCSVRNYLSTITSATTRRHLHIRAGTVDFGNGFTMNEANTGTARIVMMGGYSTEFTWRRDRWGSRTTMTSTNFNYPLYISSGGVGPDLVTDGIGADLGNGSVGIYAYNGQVSVFNGVFRTTSSPVSLVNVDGWVAGNLFIGTPGGFMPAVAANGTDATRYVRVAHNAFVGDPSASGQLQLGMQPSSRAGVSANTIVARTNDALANFRPMQGPVVDNLFVVPTAATRLVAYGVKNANLAGLSIPPNRLQSGCDGSLGADTWASGWAAPASSTCRAQASRAAETDPLRAALLRYDAVGIPRPVEAATSGPLQAVDDDGDGVPHWVDNCPDLANPLQNASDCLNYRMTLTAQARMSADVGVPQAPFPTAHGNQGSVTFGLRHVNGVTTDVVGLSGTLRVPGTSIVELSATDSVGRTAKTWTVLEGLPPIRSSGQRLYYDPDAATDGDGTQATPYKLWASVMGRASTGGPTDVIAAAANASTTLPAAMPFWSNMRIYGGYQRARGWLRMPQPWASSTFTVENQSQTGGIPINPGLVLDGVRWNVWIASSSGFAQHAVSLSTDFKAVRSTLQCNSAFSSGVTCFRMQNASSSTVLVSNLLLSAEIPFNRQDTRTFEIAGADPLIAFNDHRFREFIGFGPRAFRFESGGTLRFFGNRFTRRYSTANVIPIAFSLPGPLITPSVFVGNALAGVGETIYAIGETSAATTLSDLASRATSNGTGVNGPDPACLGPPGEESAELPGGSCLNAVPISLLPSDPDLRLDLVWTRRGEGDGLADIGALELP